MHRRCAIIFAGLLASGVCHAGDKTVGQSNKKFDPDTLMVKKGQTVTFENHDPFSHNVYSTTPGLAFDLRTQSPGKSSDVTFDKSGEVQVQCAIHPTMKMTIKVVD